LEHSPDFLHRGLSRRKKNNLRPIPFMRINEELKNRIGHALNESRLLGIEFEEEKNLVACSFGVISMDKDGNVPDDNRLLFIFNPVGRFVASYRNGYWDDKNATVENFEPKDILEVIQQFQGQAIYGWNFVNCGDKDFDTWKDRLSFDYSTGRNIGLTNTIDLFQAGDNKHIDLRIWFDQFEILTPDYTKVDLQDFIDNGKRGWDAIYENNEKMGDFGIIPATPENEQKLKDAISAMTTGQKTKKWWTKLKDKFNL
jgi:hypothetical protein